MLTQVGCLAGSGADETGLDVASKSEALAHGQIRGEQCTQTLQDTLSSFAVYTTASLTLGPDVRIQGGNVGVRDGVDPAPVNGAQLKLRERARIDVTKTTFAKDADLQAATVVGALQTDADHIMKAPTATVGPISPFPMATPIPPSVGTVTPETTGMFDVTVAMNTMPPAINGGVYRDVMVGANSQLTLNAGEYTFRKITMAGSSRIFANGPVTLKVSELIRVGDAARLDVNAGRSASDIVIMSAAGPQGFDADGEIPAINFAPYAVAHALIIAPNAHIRFEDEARIRGALFSRSAFFVQGTVDTSASASVIWEDGIPGENCDAWDCSPEAIDDGDPCTADLCTAEFGPTHPDAADGTTCDFSGSAGACLAGECQELCGEPQTLVGDPYHRPAVYAADETPPGLYVVSYVTGCMKYNPLWYWSVNAVADDEFSWSILDSLTKARAPGSIGFFNGPNPPNPDRNKPGFATQHECIEWNQEHAVPIVFNHQTNDRIGVQLWDHPYTDNRTGPMGLRPTWSITAFCN